MTDQELIQIAQRGFDEAQKRAGSADIVARVRRMPDGAVDVLWNRRGATEQRLRMGMSGAHPALARIARGLVKPAPKGHFYVLAITATDDSDAALIVAPKTPPAPVA